MPSYLQLYGAVEVALQKKTALTIEKNFQIGGNQNGRLLLNSHQEELFSITMFQVLRILMESLSHASLSNGLKL